MAETQRTPAELLALYPDNTDGAISPQDLRDFVESMKAPHGKVSMAGNTTNTVISTIGVFVPVAGVFTAGGSPGRFTEGTNGRLTYTGVSERHMHIVSTLSLAAVAGTNQQLALEISKNGTSLADSKASNLFKTAGDELSMVCHGDIIMTTNDYIEISVANMTSTNDILVHDAYLFTMGMFHT